jgi:osmotically-inducible protein OsmY
MAINADWQPGDTAEARNAAAERSPPDGTKAPGITAGDQFSESNRRDAGIADSARRVLGLKRYLPGEQTPSVAVKDGWVILWGEVDRDYKRQPAARAVFRLQGVKGVTDLIAVRPSTLMDLEVESS